MGNSEVGSEAGTRWIATCYPFAWEYVLAYLGRSADEILDVVSEGAVRRVVAGDAGLSLVEVGPEQHAEETGLAFRVLAGAPPDEGGLQNLRRQFLTGLPDDLDGFSELLARELWTSFNRAPIVQAGSPYEALVWAILGQQINVQFAYRLKRAFVEHYGEQIEYEGETYFAFPRAERVAELEHERDLRPLQFSRQKSRYIIELSRAVVRGELDFDRMGAVGDADASRELQSHLGIGRWTAEYVLLRGLGRLDVLPAGDAGLKAAVGVHLGLGRNASEDEVREIAEDWSPYRGAIGFLIWLSLQYGWFHKASRIGR